MISPITIGKVADNADPSERCRVRVRVPGRFEPHTDWLRAISMVGDGQDHDGVTRGGCTAPPIGTEVLVLFADNASAKGYYIPINMTAYGTDGEPIFQWKNVKVSISEDEALIVTDGANKIEFQTQTGTILVSAPNRLVLRATLIEIRAPSVKINDRVVLPVGDEI
jgi:hypothetical protein